MHHFYHVYADGQCEAPIREHIRALKESGLYYVLDTFAIGLVGAQNKRDEAIACLHSLGVEFTICAESDTGWEQETQIPMHAFSQTNDGLILYAHTKGASDWNEVNVRWRRSMIYWCVARWLDCVKHLKTHKAVGCHWIYPLIDMVEHKYGNPMYAGTFFWTHCELMRTWMVPPLGHRHNAEGWIGYGYVEKPFRLYDFTPYFPNTNTFYDGWIADNGYKPDDAGKSVEPV